MSLSGAIEAPAYLSVIIIYAKFGRQSSATALLVFAACAVGATAFVAASESHPTLAARQRATCMTSSCIAS